MTADLEYSRTHELKAAVVMLWLSIAVGLSSAVLQGDVLEFLEYKNLAAFMIFLGYVFWIVLVIKIGKGRNWARWLLLLVFVIGTFGYWKSGLGLFERSTLEGCLSVMEALLQIGAIYLLFTNPASSWFRR